MRLCVRLTFFVTSLGQADLWSEVKGKVLLLYSATRQAVSVALYNLGVSHHLEVIRADGQLTSHAGIVPSICPPYVFAGPNFTPWYGGASQ